LHRPSDVEYANTVADLLGVTLPAGASFAPSVLDLPGVDSLAAFDNLASAPEISPPSFQAYFASALDLAERTFADAAARQRILICAPSSPDDVACDERVIRAFGLRAWRRPLDADEVAGLVALARAARASGEDFGGSMKRVVVAMLASETFLHRIERDPGQGQDDPTRVHSLTPYELASRLSYLLWSSMPDEALFQLAGTGELWSTDVLAAQVTRLLADARADAFVRNFAGQWLGFRALEAHATPATLPGWSVALSRSMQEEARLYVAEFLQEDRGLWTFLTEDLNFVDDTLAPIYGMPAPGAQGRPVRVEGAADGRKGFLGLAAFLTATSASAESSPARRGAAILRNLLCVDLGPDPKAVESVVAGTPRQRLAALATRAECAGCHVPIEELGLGLESFDGLGRVRTKYAATDFLDIDPTGALPDGTPFSGLSELADLLQRDPRFLDCVSRKALVYALGRPLVAGDAPSLTRLRADWDARGQTLRGLLGAIVVSDTFRFRRGETP
jgi:hypothetical protein